MRQGRPADDLTQGVRLPHHRADGGPGAPTLRFSHAVRQPLSRPQPPRPLPLRRQLSRLRRRLITLPPPPPPGPPAEDVMQRRIAQLSQLGELRTAGVLSDAEFEAQKAVILAS